MVPKAEQLRDHPLAGGLVQAFDAELGRLDR
jgi:hypothetical protein